MEIWRLYKTCANRLQSLYQNTGDYLNLHPSELNIPFELNKQISCSMQLTNNTDQFIAFKIKTNNPEKYCACPNAEIIFPRSVCNVTFTMQAQEKPPTDMLFEDKFLLLAVPAPNGTTIKDHGANMFNKKNKAIQRFKFRVAYIPANLPSPVPEESEEGSSPRTEDGSQNSSGPDVATRSIEPKVKLSSEGADNIYIPPSSLIIDIGRGQVSSYIHDGNLGHEVEDVSGQAPSLDDMARDNMSSGSTHSYSRDGTAPTWNALNIRDSSTMITESDNLQEFSWECDLTTRKKSFSDTKKVLGNVKKSVTKYLFSPSLIKSVIKSPGRKSI